MRKSNNVLFKISIIINVLMIFFGAYIGNLYIIQFIALGCTILSSNLKKIKIKLDTLAWILVGVIAILSVGYSIEKSISIEICSLICMAIVLKILYENKNEEWNSYFLKWVALASGIHVIFTVLQLVVPDLVMTINKLILGAEGFKTNYELYRAGGYAGITSQTSVNAFYITIFIGIIFSRIMFKKEYKKTNMIFLCIAIIALFLTGKRGMLIFSMLSMILIFMYILYKDNKNILKYILIFGIIGTIGTITVINVPEAKVIFEKMQLLEENEEILNGRDELWIQSLEIFKKHPIMGIGMGSVKNLIGDYSHNVYIQMLAETGIIGFSIYVIAIIFSLYVAIKKANKILKANNLEKKVNILISIFIQCIFIMYGFTGNPLYGQYFIIPYIISIAMANSIKEENEVENRNNYLSQS